jgi:putative transposase
MVTPAARREAVAHLRTSFEVSERRACIGLGVDRTSVRYRSSRPDDAVVRARLRELAAIRRRFGYRRLLVLMRREGLVMNHKKFRRLYREERLQVRRRGGRKRAIGTRAPITIPQGPNQRWSLDFLSDAFADGRRFRIFALSTTSRANAWRWSPTPRCRDCGSCASWRRSLPCVVVRPCASPTTAPS